MKCVKDDLWLELEEEYTDFLWSLVRQYHGESGEVADGNKMPGCRIDDMMRSLYGCDLL